MKEWEEDRSGERERWWRRVKGSLGWTSSLSVDDLSQMPSDDTSGAGADDSRSHQMDSH